MILLLVSSLFLGANQADARAPEPSSSPVAGDSESLDGLFEILKDEDYIVKVMSIRADVVTGSGNHEEKAISPTNITVVGREEIQRRGWRSLQEVLGNVVGFYVIDDLASPAVSVRGVSGGLRAGTRILKIMINGVAVNFRADLNAFIGPEYIPMEVVERIEIAKGPLSAIYGANAFLATVNVITRAPTEGVHAEVAVRGHQLRATPGYGASGMLSFGSASRGLIIGFTYDKVDRSGLQLRGTFAQQDTIVRLAEVLGQASKADISTPASVYAQAFLDSQTYGRLTLQGGLQHHDSAVEFQPGSLLTHQSQMSLLNFWTSAQYQKVWDKGFGLSIMAGYTHGEALPQSVTWLTGNTNFSFHPHLGSDAINASATGSWSMGEQLAITIGADGEFDNERVLFYDRVLNETQEKTNLLQDGDRTTQQLYDVGGYIQARSTPFTQLRGLHFTGNFRVDKVSYGSYVVPPQWSWRLAAVYEWTESFVTKLIAGRAFQSPSATQLFAHSDLGVEHNVVGHEVLAKRGLTSTHLTPQTIQSVELVNIGRVGNYLTVEGSVFFQQLDDKIEFALAGSDFVASNRGLAQMVGAELSARVSINRFLPYVWGNYHYLFAQQGIQGSSQQFPDFQVAGGVDVSIPEIYLNLNANARLAGARAATQSNFLLNNLKTYELAPYWLLNLAVSTKEVAFFGPNTGTMLTFAVRNVLDNHYSDPGFGGVDLPAIGRTFYLELRQRF